MALNFKFNTVAANMNKNTHLGLQNMKIFVFSEPSKILTFAPWFWFGFGCCFFLVCFSAVFVFFVECSALTYA